MRELELEWVAEKAASLKPGAVWLEVGTWMGRSWAAAALNLPESSTIVSIDSFDGGVVEDVPLRYVRQHGRVLRDFTKIACEVWDKRPDLKIQIIAMKSIDAARFIPDGSCDVAFIDADHTKEAARSDIEAYLPKLKPDGLMCGHDISAAGVYTALHGYRHMHDSTLSGSIWWIMAD